MNDTIIEAKHLSRVFEGNKIAVNNLSFKVSRGQVFGLLGRNGCGKTTTLKMIMGLLHADKGGSHILGHDMITAPHDIRQRVAYVSQTQQLHDWMTVSQLCTYVSHFYLKWDQNYAENMVDKFGLQRSLPIGLMSGGEQRKVAVLLALATQPEVLILDEPAAGMDPISRRELIDCLVDLLSRIENCTVILSTHILGDLERIADVIGVMNSGNMTFCERLDTIQSSFRRVQLIFDGKSVPTNFTLPGALKTDIQGPVMNALVRITDESELDHFKENPDIRLMIHPVGLEEAFVEYLGKENF
jgi:ABC-2 type transport system ATP-binding protein